MSVLRRSSITSLAECGRTTPPTPDVPNLDFCNAFWGLGDVGVDVLFTRMRGAAQTMEELRTFWKERSTIEEEYSKRLANLAKIPIGKDEIGDLRESLDTLRIETNRQAGFHLLLAQRMRTEIEAPVDGFISKQQLHKQTDQAAIEKMFKLKQTREQHVSKAREKYETDCLRINSYASQSMRVVGTDLEEIQLKLERAQQSMELNQHDHVQFTKTLRETMPKWEQDWKAFCDMCQDLEEERLGLLYDVLWAYANNVSEICVSDDRSCERMRIALNHFVPKTDLEMFVRDYGTGDAIPELPALVDYVNTDATPVSTIQVTTRPANFVRSRQTVDRPGAPSQNGELYDDINDGAAWNDAPSHGTRSGGGTTEIRSPSPTNAVSGHVSPTREPQDGATARNSTVSAGDPTTSRTQLAIGDREWDVDPNNDPRETKVTATQTSPQSVGEQDALVKHVAEPNMAAAASGNASKHTSHRDDPPSPAGSRNGASEPTAAGANTAPGDLSSVVVGSLPLAAERLQAGSPNPPESVVAVPPPSAPRSTSSTPVEQANGSHRDQVISYIGPLPPAMSRVSSRAVSRSSSRGGRSVVDTQPLVPRPPSAARGPGSVTTVQSRNVGSRAPGVPPSNGAHHRSMSISRRTVQSTNPVGIALGPDGRVVQSMTVQQAVRQVPGYKPPGPPPPPPPPPPSHENQPHSYSSYHASSQNLMQLQQPQPLPLHSDYMAMMSNALEGGHPLNHGHLPQPPDYHDTSHAEPYTQPAQLNYGNQGSVTRSGQPQRSQTMGHIAANARPQRQATNANVHRSTSLEMMRPSPAPPVPQLPAHHPPPAWTHTDNGREVLFYVKALYDYTATMEEEFDFQEGDIIAVTRTPEDGWWSGELLDDMRRQPGRHVFPSNFVCLF